MRLAHNAGCLSKKSSKHMDELHDWSDPGDQLAIPVSIFFELLRLVSYHNKDLIWGTAEFELIGEVVLGEVDSRLFGVVLQCAIKDELEPGCR
jgi:hypothetical protein